MRFLASLGLLVGLVTVAGCGEVPQTFIDAGTDATGGGCAPACSSDGTCANGACTCNAGFTGDGVTCTDVNECQTANGGCDPSAVCNNLPGSRSCVCMAGYLGNGLSCRPIWRQVGMLAGVNVNPENFGALATGLGNQIYFGPRANTSTSRFMRAYNVDTGMFSGPLALPPGTQPDFCACGLTSVLLSDGQQLFLLGNDGYRYVPPPMNTWVQIAGYANGFQRGEAAGTFDANNGLILLVGGRSNETTAINLRTSTLVFGSETGTLPVAMSSAVAFTPAGNNITYIAGGDNAGGTALIRHATGSGVWTPLTDAPGNLGRAVGMGDLGSKLWVAARNGLYIYDPATNAWAPNPLPVPPGFVRAVDVGNRAFALVQNGANLEIHELLNIE